MNLGSFCLIKNEIQWIAAHLEMWLPCLDEMVFFDGNSTDGTLEVLRHFHKEHDFGFKVKVFEDKDPKDLKDDYVRLSNEAMRSLKTDLAAFLHPDMCPANVLQVFDFKKRSQDTIAASARMRSFAGDPGGNLYEIIGRGVAWKNIYRLRNPDFGAHYFGHYGAHNEDVYFKEITGDNHDFYGEEFNQYPYPVQNSGIEILHFSDVRPYERRLGRMVSCLKNQKWPESVIQEKAKNHPRVTLKDGEGLRFIESDYPELFVKAKKKYQFLEAVKA